MPVISTVITATAPETARRSALVRLCLTEVKLLTRERVRLAITIGIPLILLILIGKNPSLNQPEAAYGGRTFFDLYTIVLVVLALGLLSLTNMPMMLAGYREKGVLRRLQTTPIGPVRVLAAQLAATFAVAVVTVALMLAVARIGFGVPLPRQPAGFVIALLLTAAALMSLGLIVAAIAPTGRTAQGIGALVLYPLMFFGGLWLPIPDMSATLQHISHATPFGAAVPALTAAAFGSWPTALQLLTMAGWAVAFGLAAARFFRWE